MDGVTETGSYDSQLDTQEHQYAVQGRIQEFRDHLKERARLHDRSKLEPPEKEVFDRVTPQLAGLTLRLNIDRFKIEPQLQSILENTIAEMEWARA